MEKMLRGKKMNGSKCLFFHPWLSSVRRGTRGWALGAFYLPEFLGLCLLNYSMFRVFGGGCFFFFGWFSVAIGILSHVVAVESSLFCSTWGGMLWLVGAESNRLVSVEEGRLWEGYWLRRWLFLGSELSFLYAVLRRLDGGWWTRFTFICMAGVSMEALPDVNKQVMDKYRHHLIRWIDFFWQDVDQSGYTVSSISGISGIANSVNSSETMRCLV